MLLDLIGQFGVAFIFACVLVEQAGVPIPAYPVLLFAGSLVATGEQSFGALLAAAVSACLVADSLWYAAGRRFGRRILRLLCKLSLTPDGCVRQTETIFVRWGARSLTVAKFVPGFASVATAMAGSTGIGRPSFLVYDAIGSALWAGSGLALGWLFAPAIDDVLLVLAEMGKWGLLLLALLLLLFVASKLWTRRQFQQQLRMERIAVPAVIDLQRRGEMLTIVDVRAALPVGEQRIAGAIVLDDGRWPVGMPVPPLDTLVVTYCACPNEASAALMAKRLMKRGYKRVLPLAGGLDAWRDAGLDLST